LCELSTADRSKLRRWNLSTAAASLVRDIPSCAHLCLFCAWVSTARCCSRTCTQAGIETACPQLIVECSFRTRTLAWVFNRDVCCSVVGMNRVPYQRLQCMQHNTLGKVTKHEASLDRCGHRHVVIMKTWPAVVGMCLITFIHLLMMTTPYVATLLFATTVHRCAGCRQVWVFLSNLHKRSCQLDATLVPTTTTGKNNVNTAVSC
jgi:hypothetical protein